MHWEFREKQRKRYAHRMRPIALFIGWTVLDGVWSKRKHRFQVSSKYSRFRCENSPFKGYLYCFQEIYILFCFFFFVDSSCVPYIHFSFLHLFCCVTLSYLFNSVLCLCCYKWASCTEPMRCALCTVHVCMCAGLFLDQHK